MATSRPSATLRGGSEGSASCQQLDSTLSLHWPLVWELLQQWQEQAHRKGGRHQSSKVQAAPEHRELL